MYLCILPLIISNYAYPHIQAFVRNAKYIDMKYISDKLHAMFIKAYLV